MREVKRLEQAAIAAHATGTSWVEFWPSVATDVAQAEPHDARRYHRLVRRLVGLVASGDTDGQTAAGDHPPPEADDPPVYPATDDTTQARCLWQPGRQAGA